MYLFDFFEKILYKRIGKGKIYVPNIIYTSFMMMIVFLIFTLKIPVELSMTPLSVSKLFRWFVYDTFVVFSLVMLISYIIGVISILRVAIGLSEYFKEYLIEYDNTDIHTEISYDSINKNNVPEYIVTMAKIISMIRYICNTIKRISRIFRKD